VLNRMWYCASREPDSPTYDVELGDRLLASSIPGDTLLLVWGNERRTHYGGAYEGSGEGKTRARGLLKPHGPELCCDVAAPQRHRLGPQIADHSQLS
jgi:hypothetical protein